MGIGVVFRDDKGAVLAATTSVFSRIKDAATVESLAVRMTLGSGWGFYQWRRSGMYVAMPIKPLICWLRPLYSLQKKKKKNGIYGQFHTVL